MKAQQTLVLIKPDGVKRGFIGEILSHFSYFLRVELDVHRVRRCLFFE